MRRQRSTRAIVLVAMRADTEPHGRFRGVTAGRTALHKEVSLPKPCQPFAPYPLLKSGQLTDREVVMLGRELEPATVVRLCDEVVIKRPEHSVEAADASSMSITWNSTEIDPAAIQCVFLTRLAERLRA